jgi:catalase
MFAYPDAARYRLGVNYQQLPCNRPVSAVYSPYQRDGAMRFTTNYGSDPNYVKSSLKPVTFRGTLGLPVRPVGGDKHELWAGRVTSYVSEVNDEDFEQPREFWKVLCRAGENSDFVRNVASHLCYAIPRIQNQAIGECSWTFKRLTGSDMFRKVDLELADALRGALFERQQYLT